MIASRPRLDTTHASVERPDVGKVVGFLVGEKVGTRVGLDVDYQSRVYLITF